MDGPPTPALTRITEWHEPLLGTVVEVQLLLDGEGREDEGRELIASALAEMVRLQRVLSSVDSDSEFSRWTRDASSPVSEELRSVLTETAQWQRRSAGRFNPAVGELSNLWSEAQHAGTPPSRADAQRLAETIASPRWAIDDAGRLHQLSSCGGCTLNAFAKGWIVDRIVERLSRAGVRSVTVNAGGDLRRAGPDPLDVGIEDPFRTYDNQPPIAAISITDAAVATSGSARKGFTVGETYFGHVIDPRTGWPVDAIRSISVVASDAATADVLATILGVEDATAAIAEAEDLGLAVLVVDADGEVHRSRAWRAIEIDVS